MRELVGASERMEEQHLQTQAFLRPWTSDSSYLAGFAIGAQLVVDGVTTEPPVCDSVPVGGTLIFDRKKKGNAIQVILTTTTSKFWITSVETTHISRDKSRGASSTVGRTTTQAYQREYSDSQLLWMTRGPRPLLNRSTGNVADGDYDDLATGPDGMTNSAIKFDGGDGAEVEMLAGINDDFSIQFAVKLDGTP
jgi:hypothetical protein